MSVGRPLVESQTHQAKPWFKKKNRARQLSMIHVALHLELSSPFVVTPNFCLSLSSNHKNHMNHMNQKGIPGSTFSMFLSLQPVGRATSLDVAQNNSPKHTPAARKHNGSRPERTSKYIVFIYKYIYINKYTHMN